MIDYSTDIVLELARIEREALARIRKRMAERQTGLDPVSEKPIHFSDTTSEMLR